MKNHKMTQAQIESLQNDANYVIGDNPISTAKFMRAISKGEYKPLSVKDTYTPKLFYEMVSRIKPQDLENIKINENIEIEIEVKKFAEAIGAINNNNFYNDIKNTAEYLSDIKVVFKTYDGFNTRVGLVSKTKTDEKGKITLYVDSELARKILDVKDNGNFSFLKSNVFVLQSGQAIKLYPFLKSWLNKGIYTTYPKDGKTGLETFKEQLGYNTSGYIRYNTFRSKVLEPAITEINEKTDINVSYQPTGDNLDSKKPRIDGLIFYIKAKDKIKQLAEPQKPTVQTQEPKPEKPIVQKTIQSNEPSEAEIIVLGEKLKLSVVQVQTIIGELKGNHIRAFEVLQGCINEGKTKTINSNFAYIITSLSTLGIGLWQEQKEKKQKAELQKAEKEKQLLLEKITKEYEARKHKKFIEIYENASDEIIQGFIEDFKNTSGASGFNAYLQQSGALKDYGKYTIGESLAEQSGNTRAVRQNFYRNEIANKHGVQIGYDTNDQIIILGLFENIEPQATQQSKEAPTATDRQQVATAAPTEPKPTNTLTDAQKAENIKKYNDMKLKTVEAVKIPVDDSSPVLEQSEAVEPEPEATPAPTEPELQAEAEPVEQPKQEEEPKNANSILSNLINKFTKW